MLQSPDVTNMDSDLNIPPPIVLQEEKPKSKFPIPIWLIVLFIVCMIMSVSATAFIIISKNQEAEKKDRAQQQTIFVTSTPIPTTPITPTPAENMYESTEFKYKLEYPKDWTKNTDSGVDVLEGDGVKVYLGVSGTTEKPLEEWFDEAFSTLDGAPVKGITFTNKNNITFLQTSVSSPQGPLRYYFISSNDYVVSLSFTTSDDEAVKNKAKIIYGKMLDSVTVL